jgi:hypothetical protein
MVSDVNNKTHSTNSIKNNLYKYLFYFNQELQRQITSRMKHNTSNFLVGLLLEKDYPEFSERVIINYRHMSFIQIFFVSDYYVFIFIFSKNYFSNMISPTSSIETENNEKDNSTLTSGIAALPFSEQLMHPQSTLNGNSTPDDLSSQSSTDTNENHTPRPYIDPGLVIKNRKHTTETWLSEFVSPTSAPQGSYSILSQAVKTILPERTACRLGK